MVKSKYRAFWEKDYSWLAPVKTDPHQALCKECVKRFQIDDSGLAQVKSHAKCHKKDPRQLQFVFENEATVMQKRIRLSSEDQVVKSEILQALHYAESNYSFASAATDSARFKIMFPDSQIAKSYSQGKTKMAYNINYGIAPYLKEKLIYDVRNTPFCFKLDETTNQQVQKQYDAYLQYWSKT